MRPGRVYTIKDESGAAASNNITVATEGSETIDGSATDVLSDNYGSKSYYSDGSNCFEVPLLLGAAVAHSATTGQGTDDHHTKAHTAAHASGGADAIKLDDLTAPDDNTDLNFSTTKHGLTPKGTNVGDFLKDDGTWATPAGGGSGAVTREGGDTTEATTTSPSLVGLLDATSLTMAAAEYIRVEFIARKTTGAAAQANFSFDLNATAIFVATRLTSMSNDQIEMAHEKLEIPARVTSYLRAGTFARYTSQTTAGVNAAEGFNINGHANDYPTVEITNITILGSVGNAAITMGADEEQIYSWTAS